MEELRHTRAWTLHRVSELADVLYTATRAAEAGHAVPHPLSARPLLAAAVTPYMLLKYTSRFALYRLAACRVGGKDAWRTVREVRNPAKPAKVREIAEGAGLDPDAFAAECGRLARFWPLLP